MQPRPSRPQRILTKARLLIGLCLDVSRSMAGPPLAALNQGRRDFFQTIDEDVHTQQSAEVGEFAFAGKVAQIRAFNPFVPGEKPVPVTVRLKDFLPGGEELPGGTN